MRCDNEVWLECYRGGLCSQNQLLNMLKECTISEKSLIADGLVSTVLTGYRGEFPKKVLFGFLLEEDAMLRADAIDALGEFPSGEVVETLKWTLEKDPNAIVRKFAIGSLLNIDRTHKISRLQDYFYWRLGLDSSRETQICLYFALYELGDQYQMQNILGALEDDDPYRLYFYTAGMLSYIMNEQNARVIRQKILSIKASMVFNDLSINIPSCAETINQLLRETEAYV